MGGKMRKKISHRKAAHGNGSSTLARVFTQPHTEYAAMYIDMTYGGVKPPD